MPVSITPREHPKLVRSASDPLVILLDPLDEVFHGRGYYGSDGTTMPERYRFLHPEAHAALRQLEAQYPGTFYYTDVFRNATGSKKRREKNRDARVRRGQSAIYTGKLPGFSAHSYGLSFDLDVHRSLKNLRRTEGDPGLSKADLDAVLKQHGWWCHRDGPDGGDHARGHEDWHFNYFGDDPDRWLGHSRRKTSGGVEAKVNYLYGPFVLDLDGIYEHLTRLGYTANKAGIKTFQSDWTLPDDGVAGPQTQRTLLYVGASFRNNAGAPLDVPFP